MGETCSKCFQKNQEEPSSDKLLSDFQEQPKEQSIKGFSVKEIVSLIGDCEKRLLNEVEKSPLESGFENVLDKQGVRVFCKDSQEGYSLISKWKVPIEPQNLLKFLNAYDIRTQWDKNIQTIEKVCGITEDISVFYMKFRSVPMVTQREALQATTYKQIGNNWVDVSTSVESSEFPETEKPIRIKSKIGAYFLQPLENDPEGNLTSVTSLTETNFGGSIPTGLVKRLSIQTVPKFVKSVVQNYEKFFVNGV